MIDDLSENDELENEADETTELTRRVVKRESTPKLLRPLALIFAQGVPQPSYDVTVARWSESAHAHLKILSEALKGQGRRVDIPVVGLRGRLELADPANLRLDRSVGRYERTRTILWTETDIQTCKEMMNRAVLGWLVDDVAELATSDAATHAVDQLKQLARGNRAIETAHRKAQPYMWDATQGKTAKAISSTSYADLADFVARHLAGKNVFPELAGLRRIVSGELEQNQAELMTEPITVGRSRFSLVVRVRVFSYPSRPTPVIAIEFSRRAWISGIRERATAKTITAYALPTDTNRALQFTLRRIRDDEGKWLYQPDDDFAPIARQYFAGKRLTTDDILKHGHQLTGCALLVGLKHGVGERSESKSGVPDLDKVEAFDRIVAALSTINLTPWDSIQEIDSSTRPATDRDQHWRKRDSAKQRETRRYDDWLLEAQRSIQECYVGEHHVVIAVQPGAEDDAAFAENRLQEILKGSVITTRIPIPSNVHGPRNTLPSRELGNPAERAARRIAAWATFIETVKRHEGSTGRKVDGVLVIAREWYPNRQHDDTVNKRAGRVAIADGLGVPVQYLRPRTESQGEDVTRPPRGRAKSPEEIATSIDKDFENRLMIAWLDLAYKSLGRVRPQKLAEEVQDVYGADNYPDRILALGVVRRNKNRFLLNERSFLPYAIELDVERGVCTARFAYEQAETRELTQTELLSMPQALVTLARLGPVQLTSANVGNERRRQLAERTQEFFKRSLADFGQRSRRPLVLIDADTSRSVWPWLKDEELDASNVRLADGFHAQAAWPHARLVRLRTDNSPKVVWDTEFYGIVEKSGEQVRYRAPDWAEADLFKLKDTTVSDVYFSFGSSIRTTRTRGKSCYREIQGMKQVKNPHGYVAATISKHIDAWATPTGLEIVVIRSGGDKADQIARLVEWLRQCYAHFGEWTAKPAPLFFESALKQYLADYDLEDDGGDGDSEGE